MRTTFEDPDHASERHDPMCPRADIDAAWNGATCHCVVIRSLRSMGDTEIIEIDAEAMLAEIEAKIASDEAGDRITKGHDPLCPPGLKAAPPSHCTWCVTIAQARQEGPLR